VNQRRLYRSADDRILAGVAGGVAAYFDVDPVIVRIIWFLSVFFTGSLTFWAYIVMIIVVPVEPADWPAQSPWAPGGAPVGSVPVGSGPVGYAAAYTPPTDPATGQPVPGASTAPDAGQTPEGATPPPADPNAPPASAPFVTGQPNQYGGAPAGDWRWQRRQERWQRRQERWEGRGRGSGGLMFGLILIVVGGLLAWHQYDPNIDLGLAWPIGVVALGVVLVASSIRFGNRS
jgi:phage shock protein C